MKEQIWVLASLFLIVVAENKFEKSVFPQLPVAVTDSENLKCNQESEIYRVNLENFTLWAYEMWDATAKSTSGVLRGSRFQVGHFKQCVTAEAPFLPKYCLAFLEANIPEPKGNRDPLSLEHDPNENVLEKLYPYKDVSQQTRNIIHLGWCIPASCSPQDVDTFLNKYMNLDVPLENVTYTIRVSEKTCSTKEENTEFNTADICFCSLTLLLAAFVLAATLSDNKTDAVKPSQRPVISRCFSAFSARQNFTELSKIDESNGALTILYGIKAICIFFIICAHRFGTYTGSAVINFDYVERQFREPFSPLFFHGDLFVDSFFIMGGLLVTYGLLKQLDKKRVNPGFVILLRYVRLTPAYAYVVFYYATLYGYTGSGPFWKVIAGQESQDCKNNWWTNLLYINNYVNSDQICMAQSWYLPCDFHYFIIAIGVCILLKKSKKAGLFTLLLLTIVSIIILFVVTVIYERPALLHFYPEFLQGPKVHPDFQLTYIKSHTRATSYFIGMFIGYVYYKQRGKEVHIGRIKSYTILLISVGLMMASIFGGAAFYDPYHEYNVLESAIYAALHRPAFDLGSVGIIYVCSYGHAAFIREILTWSPLIPFSKLTFGAYLWHMQFQLRYASIFMSPREFSYFEVANLAVADIVLSFVAALGLYLLVEAPFRNIFREIMMPNRASSSKEADATRQEGISNAACDSRL